MSPTAATRPTLTSDQYLGMVGARVRQIRVRRGMTRRILAGASGVSERYLAQLESGKANASVMVLSAISQALGTPLDDLLDQRTDQPADYLLLREWLRHADENAMSRALSSVTQRDKVLPDRRVAYRGQVRLVTVD